MNRKTTPISMKDKIIKFSKTKKGKAILSSYLFFAGILLFLGFATNTIKESSGLIAYKLNTALQLELTSNIGGLFFWGGATFACLMVSIEAGCQLWLNHKNQWREMVYGAALLMLTGFLFSLMNL